MATALVLGSLAALAVHRYRFFGRDALSFALILPIALPGIVTAIALNSSVHALDVQFGTLTPQTLSFGSPVVTGNAGANPIQVGQGVTVAGVTRDFSQGSIATSDQLPLLALASFIPYLAGYLVFLAIWWVAAKVLLELPWPRAVALFLILLSTLPVYLANRLTTDTSSGAAGRL